MKITVNMLSQKSIDRAAERLQNYADDLADKCTLLTVKLAEKGIQTARIKIATYDAFYTGQLLDSINYERGAVIQNGDEWIVYTDCPWAKFVEFGTGVVGKSNPHPDVGIVGWKYDTNEHGEAGWYYFRDGEWHWTKGMPSRPFMYETSVELREDIVKIAKEVFG